MTDPQTQEPCWFHRFGGGEPCQNVGRWVWLDPPEEYRTVLLAMRWCDIHRHVTDTLIEAARGREDK